MLKPTEEQIEGYEAVLAIMEQAALAHEKKENPDGKEVTVDANRVTIFLSNSVYYDVSLSKTGEVDVDDSDCY